jgi:hypothetical protein
MAAAHSVKSAVAVINETSYLLRRLQQIDPNLLKAVSIAHNVTQLHSAYSTPGTDLRGVDSSHNASTHSNAHQAPENGPSEDSSSGEFQGDEFGDDVTGQPSEPHSSDLGTGVDQPTAKASKDLCATKGSNNLVTQLICGLEKKLSWR